MVSELHPPEDEHKMLKVSALSFNTPHCMSDHRLPYSQVSYETSRICFVFDVASPGCH